MDLICSKDDLVGGDAVKNAEITREILNGKKGPKTDAVLLNAGACIYMTRDDVTYKEAINIARQTIESGKANCTIPQLYCIAQILDCSADFLLFGEEHMNYSPEMVELVNNLKMVTGRIEGEIKNSLLKTTNQKR